MREHERPLLLDTYCKAGGAGMGYFRAGFNVVGVDIEPQPNYPFEFIQGDAIEFINLHGMDFDAIHASPPCQKYSKSTGMYRNQGYEYPDLVEPTRKAMKKAGKPSVLENVPGAPMRKDLILRGDQFNLKVLRERWFEIDGFTMFQPVFGPPPGMCIDGDYCTVAGQGSTGTLINQRFKAQKSKVLDTWSHAMGIDWMTKTKELAEAIPPDYTHYIGNYLFKHIQ